MKKTSELHDRQTKLDFYIKDLEAEQSGLIETVMKNEINNLLLGLLLLAGNDPVEAVCL